MRRLQLAARAWLASLPRRATVLEVAGLAAVAVGAGLIFPPAGLIVGGVSAIFVAQGLDQRGQP